MRSAVSECEVRVLARKLLKQTSPTSAVMSMPKFRDQYDQMRLQAVRDFEKDKPKADPDAWMNR